MIFRTLNSTTRAGNITSHEHGLYLLAREFVFGSDVLPTAVKLSLDFVVPFLHEGYVGGATTLRARARISGQSSAAKLVVREVLHCSNINIAIWRSSQRRSRSSGCQWTWFP